uniref:Orf115c n=1 Tax=Batis maritima TaxID=4436 RepID=A0A068BDB3_BATMA|nr:orf115c [Batis maritima]AIC83422.1 orf115c [Batis maritima]
MISIQRAPGRKLIKAIAPFGDKDRVIEFPLLASMPIIYMRISPSTQARTAESTSAIHVQAQSNPPNPSQPNQTKISHLVGKSGRFRVALQCEAYPSLTGTSQTNAKRKASLGRLL